MIISIRNKLVFAVSVLVIVLFTIAANLFMNEKEAEIADDIYTNALSFAQLTSSKVAENYELFLRQGGFIYFNREIKSLLSQNGDISGIKMVTYSGEVLYDSLTEKDKQYEGEKRIIEDKNLIDQIRSENIAVKTRDGKIVYTTRNEKEGITYLDKNERRIPELTAGTLVDYLIVPANEKYSVIYNLDYSTLDVRVDAMRTRMIYLALFGIMLGIMMSILMSSNLTKPLKKLVDATQRFAKGDLKTRVTVKTHDETSLLGDSFNKMAKDLEASLEARVYKERVTHELKLATEIQNQILPKNVPEVKGIDIAFGLIPAEEIGGDIYDFVQVNKDRLLLYLGDVTGHGVPAGIVSSLASALFYGFATEKNNLKDIIVEVNRVLKAKTMPSMFMTLCLMEWNGKNKSLKYISAGHEKVLCYKAKKKSVELMPGGGVALSMVSDISKYVTVNDVDFNAGDFVVLYSDGIPEAWKNEKETYGMERFVEAVAKFGNLESASAIKEAILADVKQFMGKHKQMDDITLVVLKRA